MYIELKYITIDTKANSSLVKLFASNDLTPVKPKRVIAIIPPQDITHGRADYIFDQVRAWAYKEIKFYVHNSQGFLEAVTEKCMGCNLGFTNQLPTPDVVDMAKYISDWVYTRRFLFAGSDIGRRKSLRTRKVKAMDKKITANNMAGLGYGVQEIADSLGLSRTTVWKYLKIIKS